jgi:pyruvate/2-oxoacid:ferredoxin oxidoreductase alpha subunit
MMKTEFLQGNEACVKGALAAGCRFFAGYPITPASEIAHGMAYELPRLGGVFIQMEDEIASLGAVIGASLAGAKAMTATSGPGFSLMQEHIGFASIAEVPCVVINVMRGGPRDEIELVERPKPTEPPEWFVPYRDPGTGVPPMPSFGEGYRYHVTGLLHDERGYPTIRADEVEPFIKRLFQKISQDFNELQWGETYYTEDSTLNIVAFGSVARAALRAVKEARARGMKVGLLKLLILFPIMRRKVTQLMESSSAILVPEMNMGQISREVKRVNQGRCRVETLNKVAHEAMTPEEILDKIEEIYD